MTARRLAETDVGERESRAGRAAETLKSFGEGFEAMRRESRSIFDSLTRARATA